MSDPPFESPRSGVATPPTQPPDPSWLPAPPVLIDHPWQPPTHIPGDVPIAVQPAGAPVNIDVPYAQQNGAVITCTMGNWGGEPTSYAYQWRLDGATDIGNGGSTYVILAADVGHNIACIVTATNAIGTTTAPPSNNVAVTTPTTTTQGATHGEERT